LSGIRTSPDHGTAYDVAGQGVADANSFKEAVYLALDVFHHREEYKEISKNPLKVREKQEEKNNRYGFGFAIILYLCTLKTVITNMLRCVYMQMKRV
jgi:hypothetical protein